MAEHTKGDARNCRNCQQPLYFGGAYWWHKHNESGYCSKSDADDDRRAEPEPDDIERVRMAAPELLAALKAIVDGNFFYHKAGDEKVYAATHAAIAKAEGR